MSNRAEDGRLYTSRELSADRIRDLCPMIVFNELRAGDVVLSNSPTIGGKVIASVTAGKFSHAAIWLPIKIDYPTKWGHPPWYELHLSESDGSGVGETPTRLVRIDVGVGKRVFAVPFGPKARPISLVRHPGIKATSIETLCSAADQLRFDEFYKAYSPLSRLPSATTLPPGVVNVSRKILAVIDRPVDDVDKGVFCSELVGKYYSAIGLPLFPEERPPESISPNGLAQSVLEPQALAVLDASAIPDGATGAIVSDEDDCNEWSRITAIPERIQQYHSKGEGHPFTDAAAMSMYFQNQLVAKREERKAMAIKHYFRVMSHASIAQQAGQITSARHLYMAGTLHLMARALMDESERLPGSTPESMFIGPSHFETALLIEYAIENLCKRACRREILSLILSGLRRKRAENPASEVYDAYRRDMIRLWRDPERLDRTLEPRLRRMSDIISAYACADSNHNALFTAAYDAACDRVGRFEMSNEMVNDDGPFIPF